MPDRRLKQSMIIGILEDDPDQSQVIAEWLADAGHQSHVYADGTQLVRGLKSHGFEMLLLDWQVPGMNGMEVLEWVRANLSWRIPVIFVTVRDQEDQIVTALETGADDYLTKPLSKAILLARMQAVARRSGLEEADNDHQVNVEVGPFAFNRQSGQCTRAGELIELTKREFDLALYFFRNIGRILSRELLLHHVWNLSGDMQTRTVDTHVSRLRSKLGLRPDSGWNLSAVYHYGYRLEQVAAD